MEETIAEKKERYIDEACRIELRKPLNSKRDDAAERIRFWQSLTSEERMHATSEIVRRVYLARGGKPEDLRVKRNIARFVRRTR